MSSKDALRHLHALFSTSSPHATFPSLTLPPSAMALVDTYLAHFASTFATSSGEPSSSSSFSERDKERGRFRDSLLDIWKTLVEPAPGLEGDPGDIARVSAFLVLLNKLSADSKDDDESAIVTRGDIGKVWWDAVLRRVLLGTAKDGIVEARDRARASKTTSTKIAPTAKGTSTTSQLRPLTVSRQALQAAHKMVVWAMSPTLAELDEDQNFVTAFCLTVAREFEIRSVAAMRGGDEWYGLRNVAECIWAWAEKSTQTYFDRCTPHLTTTAPARIPFLSLLLTFLCRHPGKAYHVLSTSLLSHLITFCLTSPSPAAVTLGMKCLAIFLTALPVIIGEDVLMGIFAVYGRVVCWETLDLEGLDGDDESKAPDEATDAAPPNPLTLFTVLYGIYPSNFAAFLKDAGAYLRTKEWKAPAGFLIDSVGIRERSKALIRQHTLHPSLLNNDLETELTDTSRWRRLEMADVMAECERNVVHSNVFLPLGDEGHAHDFPLSDDDAGTEVDSRGRSQRGTPRDERSSMSFAQHLSEVLEDHSSRERRSASRGRRARVDESITPETIEDETAQPSHATRTPVSASRGVSISNKSADSSLRAHSRSRSPTPHMPATTHFTNFQALQQAQGSPPASLYTPGGGARSVSRLRTQHAPDFDALAFPGNLASADSSAQGSTANSSRAASIMNSPTSPLAHGPGSPQLAATMISDGLSRSNSRATATTAGTGSAAPGPVSAQIHKLETEIILLQGEVAFQTYLKGLHNAHMGTLHREKVLESGAEAERQTLYRTIRTLRAQLKQTRSSLDQLRSESSVTKANWIAHIDDLKDKLKSLREARIKWDLESKTLRAEIEDSKEREKKAVKELEEQGAAFFDLQNQVQVDSEKLNRIGEYETRIEALAKTLAVCDEDLAKFTEHRHATEVLVGEWKKSELLRQSQEGEIQQLKAQLRARDVELAKASKGQKLVATSAAPLATQDKADTEKMRVELDRLRMENVDLKEQLIDVQSQFGVKK